VRVFFPHDGWDAEKQKLSEGMHHSNRHVLDAALIGLQGEQPATKSFEYPAKKIA
jgi:hypothetical protein